MEHQDFNLVKFQSNKNKNKELQKRPNKINEETKIEVPKKLGLLISQARTLRGYKNQKDFAKLIGVNVQIVSGWESNKIIPTNAELAHIEKNLKIEKTFPRIKKLN